jgi:membrane associated rhomboid family serine protease
MTGLLVGMPWAYQAFSGATPAWAHLVAAAGGLLASALTAWLASREARKRAEKVVPFEPRRRRV